MKTIQGTKITYYSSIKGFEDEDSKSELIACISPEDLLKSLGLTVDPLGTQIIIQLSPVKVQVTEDEQIR